VGALLNIRLFPTVIVGYFPLHQGVGDELVRIAGATDPLLLEDIFRYYLPSDFSSLKYKTSAINPLEAKIALTTFQFSKHAEH